MAINQIKDDLKVNFKEGEEVIIINREIVDEYDYENILNLFKAQMKKKYNAENVIENLDGFIKEEESKIRENAETEFLRLIKIKDGVDDYYNVFKDVFYEIIPDPTTGEKEFIMDREKLRVVIEDNWDGFTRHMMETFYEMQHRKSFAEQLTKEAFDEEVDKQVGQLVDKFSSYVTAHQDELVNVEKTIEIYQPIVEKIIKEWGITMDDVLLDIKPVIKDDEIEEVEKESETIEEEE